MALIVSAQTGNFNDSNTWVGGVVPTVGDEAQAATGHIITITADTTCDELSNAGTGYFILNNGVTLTANVTSKSATQFRWTLQFQETGPGEATIIGNLLGGTNTSGNDIRGIAVRHISNGTLNIFGELRGGSFGSNSLGGGALVTTAAANVNIVGDVYGGSGNNCSCIRVQATALLNMTGNVFGGSSTNARAFEIVAGNSIINITGDVTGGSGSASHGFRNAIGLTRIDITGNVTGGSGGLGVVVETTGGVLNITGICTGGQGAAAVANNGLARIYTPLYASDFAPAIDGGVGTQITLLTGPFYMSPSLGVTANAANAWRWAESLNPNTFIEVPTSDLLSKRNFITPDNATNFPSGSDVRNGITYGISGVLSGTLVVPPSNAVALGVPVDDTVGTAILNANDIWSFKITGEMISGSAGERLLQTTTNTDLSGLNDLISQKFTNITTNSSVGQLLINILNN